MRSRLLFCILLAALPFATTSAQQNLPAAVLQAYGVIASVRDVTLTGTVTDANGRQRTLRAFVKGKDKMRYETGDGADRVITILNQGVGWTITVSATRVMSEHVAAQRPIFLPFLDLLGEVVNPSLQVRNVAINRLDLHLPDPAQQRHLKGYPLDQDVTYEIDPATLLVLRATTTVPTEGHQGIRTPTTIEFADYRTVGLIRVPFRFTRWTGIAGGISQSVVVWQTVTLNQNLPDTLFHPQ